MDEFESYSRFKNETGRNVDSYYYKIFFNQELDAEYNRLAEKEKRRPTGKKSQVLRAKAGENVHQRFMNWYKESLQLETNAVLNKALNYQFGENIYELIINFCPACIFIQTLKCSAPLIGKTNLLG